VQREPEREFEVVASGEPVETITKSATREFTGILAEQAGHRLVFSACFLGNFAASQVLRESSEAPKSVVTATAGSVHGASTLSSPIADQPASIQPGCILAGWTYAIPRLRFDGTPKRPPSGQPLFRTEARGPPIAIGLYKTHLRNGRHSRFQARENTRQRVDLH